MVSKEKYHKRKDEEKCPKCGDELPDYYWDCVKCPECAERDRNLKFYGIYATSFELETGRY